MDKFRTCRCHYGCLRQKNVCSSGNLQTFFFTLFAFCFQQISNEGLLTNAWHSLIWGCPKRDKCYLKRKHYQEKPLSPWLRHDVVRLAALQTLCYKRNATVTCSVALNIKRSIFRSRFNTSWPCFNVQCMNEKQIGIKRNCYKSSTPLEYIQ